MSISRPCFVCIAAEKIYNRPVKKQERERQIVKVTTIKEKILSQDYAHDSCLFTWIKSEKVFRKAKQEKGVITHVNGIPLSNYLRLNGKVDDLNKGQAFLAAAEIGDETKVAFFHPKEGLDATYYSVALSLAAKNCHLNVVRHILSEYLSAEVDLQPSLLAAVEGDEVEIFEAILSRYSKDVIENLKSLLLRSIKNGNERILKDLLKRFNCAVQAAELALMEKSFKALFLIIPYLRCKEGENALGSVALFLTENELFFSLLSELKDHKIPQESCRKILSFFASQNRFLEIRALLDHRPDIGNCNEAFQVAYKQFYIQIMIELAQRRLLYLDPIPGIPGKEVSEELSSPFFLYNFYSQNMFFNPLDVQKVIVCASLMGKFDVIWIFFNEKKINFSDLSRVVAIYMQIIRSPWMNLWPLKRKISPLDVDFYQYSDTGLPPDFGFSSLQMRTDVLPEYFDANQNFQMRGIYPHHFRRDFRIVSKAVSSSGEQFFRSLERSASFETKITSKKDWEMRALINGKCDAKKLAGLLIEHGKELGDYREEFSWAKTKGDVVAMALLLCSGRPIRWLRKDPDFFKIFEVHRRGCIAYAECLERREEEAVLLLNDGEIFEDAKNYILFTACAKGMGKVVDAILANNQIHAATSSKSILVAFQNGFFELGEKLLQAGGISEEFFRPVKEIAARENREPALTFLREKGALAHFDNTKGIDHLESSLVSIDSSSVLEDEEKTLLEDFVFVDKNFIDW